MTDETKYVTTSLVEKLGEFQCSDCGYCFTVKPGPHVMCPRCLSQYVNWLNYETDFVRG